jgi:hypothetical protein
MFSRLTKSYANVTATLALAVALGGTAYAAVVVTGADVQNGSLTGVDVKNNSLSGRDIQAIRGKDIDAEAVKSSDIADGTVAPEDLHPDALAALGNAAPEGGVAASGPPGPKGDAGPAGPAGKDGRDGTSGASNFTVRSAQSPISVTCGQDGAGICGGVGHVTATCKPGETAIAGGSGDESLRAGSDNGTVISYQHTQGVDRPNPISGTPTGWTIEMVAFSYGGGSPEEVESAPVYVVCAS